MRKPVIHTVTGATGYTGRYITDLLLRQGHDVQSITGHPDRHNPFGNQVPLHRFNFDRPDLLAETLAGTDTLFNTYWIRVNYRGRTHEQCVEQTKVMFKAAKAAGVRRIVHISITNPDPQSDLPYFRGKGQLEDALRGLYGVSHAILRPTVLYSTEDILLNNIAWTLRKFPLVLLPGHGNYGIQPVFVEDLALLAVDAADRDDNIEMDAVGLEVFTYAEMVRLVRGQDRRTLLGGAVPEAAHIPGRPPAGAPPGRHRPHQGRDQGTVPRTAGLALAGTRPSSDQAQRMAGRERRPARTPLRERGGAALWVATKSVIRMSPAAETYVAFTITAVWVPAVFVVLPGIVAVAGAFVVGLVASIPILIIGCLVRLVKPQDPG